MAKGKTYIDVRFLCYQTVFLDESFTLDRNFVTSSWSILDRIFERQNTAYFQIIRFPNFQTSKLRLVRVKQRKKKEDLWQADFGPCTWFLLSIGKDQFNNWGFCLLKIRPIVCFCSDLRNVFILSAPTYVKFALKGCSQIKAASYHLFPFMKSKSTKTAIFSVVLADYWFLYLTNREALTVLCFVGKRAGSG